ncbi:MAG: maleylpyruvate isomerase N-terminal domain-containing protein [Acidimicrobiales bacterium]
MASVVVPVDASEAQAAVGAVSARFSALLRSATKVDAPALGRWSLTDVAIHVSHALDAVTAVVQGGGALVDDLWGLSNLTAALVAGESTRSLTEIADRIDASAARLVALLADQPAEETRAWIIGGIEIPLATVTCHALNELVVHGWDVAHAEGAPWPISDAEARLVVCGFLFTVMSKLGAQLIDPAAAGRRACFEIRVRGGGRAYLHFDGQSLVVAANAPVPVDCHLSVDPAAFLLVAWGRIDQWPSIGRGRLLAWGRKPWLGLSLTKMLRNP